MQYFVKHFWPEWDSKRDMLSMAVAGIMGGEYWYPGAAGRTVVQSADGKCDVPSGCTPSVLIRHDPLDCGTVRGPVLRIGLGDIPGCSVNLRSYPLRKKDLHRLPLSAAFDAVVGGRCPDAESCEEAIERASLTGLRVAVAIPGNPGIAREAAGILERSKNSATVIDDPSLPIISVLYRSCVTVVHLGDCMRGYLHSLAMYHASAPGRRLVERVPGLPGFEPAGIGELVRALGG